MSMLAFTWCGWNVVTPIDLERDVELDVFQAPVRRALYEQFPKIHLIARAMSCSAKSRAREKQDPRHRDLWIIPAGLPDLSHVDQEHAF